MKKLIFIVTIILSVAATNANAQYVRVRPGFSIRIHVGPQGRAPYRDAIWIGPEWQWRDGRYIEIPGRWERPRRFGERWIPGHWKYTRHGYKWIPGHWR